MTGILVTGGMGFILSNLVSSLLSACPDAEIAVLDLAVKDRLAREFFGAAGSRLQLFEGDVRDPEILRSISKGISVSHVVHGATVTHDAETERTDPTRYINVNLGGTVALLEWLRTLTGLRRFVYVSTGGVYGGPQPGSPMDIQSEIGPFDPPELYAVSKYAAELVVRRYANLFDLPACRVRLSDIFGPMERPTKARRLMSLPYRMMRALIERRPLRITGPTLEAGGDYLSAEDVASAILAILKCESLPYDLFNIAAGVWRTVPEIFTAFAAVAPSFQHETAAPDEAEVDLNPANRLARYNAYAISRIRELGWRPRRLEEQFGTYLEWVMQEPEARCPC
jgi:nucleoside-diphosphate-sugar epimerase